MNMFPYSSSTSAYKAGKRKPKEFDVRGLAYKIRDAIAALPDEPSSPAKVPAIFAAAAGTAEQKFDAFSLLDEKPGGFSGNYFYWHSILRKCRNNPVYGRALFDAINNRY